MDKMVKVKKSFILQKKHKTASEIAGIILKKLEDKNLEVDDCRGQGYDSAAPMACIHSGVQQCIKELDASGVH